MTAAPHTEPDRGADPAATIAVRNGNVWTGGGFVAADVLISGGRIAAVGRDAGQAAATIVDASGHLVLPGFIDVHTHLDDRIGGCRLADDYRSGTACAIENGITTVATFITEGPDLPLRTAAQQAFDRARDRIHCNVTWHITPTRFDDEGWRAVHEQLDSGCRTIKLYTTYRQAGIFSEYGRLEEIFSHLKGSGVRFLIHCEDDGLLQSAADAVAEWSNPEVHAVARPPEAEAVAICRLLPIAARHHAAVHIVHVSTPTGLDLIAAARSGQDVTCETAPHYLFLNESMLQRPDGHRWLCSPPLRQAVLQDGLLRRARSGMIDMFATDHCPFFRRDKDAGAGDVRTVPNGIPGIGALPHLVVDLFRNEESVLWGDVVRTLAENPARLLGLFPRKGTIEPGSDADLVVLRPDGPPREVRSTYADVHETYPGRTSRLSLRAVLLDGRVVVRDGRLTEPSYAAGRCVWPN